ncbi:ankyrin repeat-containing domain protein [Pyronema omphalodes]|nr:ankyrin repeat-containing domain protein [Pyronema omphalodes]
MTTTYTPATLSEEQIDDLLYFARAGETDEFLSTLEEIKTATKSTGIEILLAARDEHSLNNVLHMAAANGHLELSKKILSILPAPTTPDAVPFELVSQKNSGGNTPLHWAALNGHLEVVKILVMAANADPTITNNVGHDAVYEAQLNDKNDVVDWLLKHCDGLEEVVAGDLGEVDGAGASGDAEEEVETIDMEDEEAAREKLKQLAV